MLRWRQVPCRLLCHFLHPNVIVMRGSTLLLWWYKPVGCWPLRYTLLHSNPQGQGLVRKTDLHLQLVSHVTRHALTPMHVITLDCRLTVSNDFFTRSLLILLLVGCLMISSQVIRLSRKWNCLVQSCAVAAYMSSWLIFVFSLLKQFANRFVIETRVRMGCKQSSHVTVGLKM